MRCIRKKMVEDIDTYLLPLKHGWKNDRDNLIQFLSRPGILPAFDVRFQGKQGNLSAPPELEELCNQTKSNNTCDLNNVDPYRLQDTHTVALRGMQDAYEEVAKGLDLGGAGCNLTGPIPMQEPNTCLGESCNSVACPHWNSTGCPFGRR